MNITLDMAQPLDKQIKLRLAALYKELNTNMEVTYRRGEEPELPDRKVEIILDEITKLEADRRRLLILRDKANLENEVPWAIFPNNATRITITEGLYLVKDMRATLSLLNSMSSGPSKPTSHLRAYMARQGNTVADEITEPTYDVVEYRKKAETLERKVNALSIALDKANQTTVLDFDASDYFDGLL